MNADTDSVIPAKAGIQSFSEPQGPPGVAEVSNEQPATNNRELSVNHEGDEEREASRAGPLEFSFMISGRSINLSKKFKPESL